MDHTVYIYKKLTLRIQSVNKQLSKPYPINIKNYHIRGNSRQLCIGGVYIGTYM